ncbi:Peptidyl-prolyl cis-trans isomerase CYP63 [Zea mays]|uniref:peptidylprolyl isomerase n=1 Tax=Zea mays TaxID=4577 RepID=A0A3L6DZD4_MAIZE|nr:Peptidyl-prolyl cis-trans isomerase CYP63 [Zea mays]
MPKVKNPHVFMDISIGGGSAERITFELFANVVPKTAENFRALCTGERGLGASTQKPLYYKGTYIHRIVKGFVAQGGDFSSGDGKGGESIYGGKFPDENFKLLHNQPGVLSMANSGPGTNGSQFFITFKALPHLDGKHVVFGKVVSGIALLKNLEAAGSETGNPSCQVKIVDCGEVSNTNSQDLLKGEKEKKLRTADGNSNAEGRAKLKKASGDYKQRKKRKHYSSDSYSSDTSDSSSYSSDSGSDSESQSSMNTSSSSDHRRKRRKGSKKDKRKLTKRKGKHTRSKRKSRGSKRRPRRSYGSSSDDSVSSKTDNSSSDSENGGHYTKRSLPKDKESTKMTNSEQGRTFPDVDKVKQTVTTINRSQSHDGSKPSNKDDNGADDRSGNYSSKDRNDPGASSRISPIQTDVNLTKPVNVYGNIGGDNADAGMSITGTERHLPSNEPVSTNGKDLAVGSADNGQPQRIRKGRGFTQKYGFARRYRTPSPERPPVRPRYDGGREDRWNNFNRYGRTGPYSRRSPVRRYHGSPRANSPSRYQRRGRSRSRSPATRHDRGGYRRPSPRRSRSPADPRRDANDRPRSGHGGGGPDHRGHSPPANNRSRSKSLDPLRSRSPDAAPAKRESSRYNRRRSSSSRSSSPDADGNKGLVSY